MLTVTVVWLLLNASRSAKHVFQSKSWTMDEAWKHASNVEHLCLETKEVAVHTRPRS